MQNITTTRSLDVKGLNCPMPILRTKIVLGEMASGEILAVLSTDPHSVPDFRAFCAHTGNELLQITESGEIFEFLIRRA